MKIKAINSWRLMDEEPGAGGGGGDPAPAPNPGGDPAPGGDPSPNPAPSDPAPQPDPAPESSYFQKMPDDWRVQALNSMGLTEGDEFDKRKGQMERHTDFASFAKSGFDAQDRIRKGEISNGLPENATDEQMAEWREANGVPAEAGGYELSLDEGLVLGEADERIISGVYDVAHAGNVPAETMSALTNAMLKGRQAEAEAMVAQDGVDKQTTDRQLKEAWSGDFETNVNMVKGLINQLPETVRDAFGSARMPDGKAVFNSPEIMVAMADWSRKLNPAATVVPNSSNPVASINDEIKSLEDRMGEPGWHKDTGAQERLLKLYSAREDMSNQT